MNYAIVLAAGKGTRMKTELPKCAYPLLRKPMAQYIVENLEKSAIDQTILVVGHKKEIFEVMFEGRVKFAHQAEQLGTGHATLMAEPLVTDLDGYTLILPGDMPLITDTIITQLLNHHVEGNYDLTVVTSIIEEPYGYGRIVRNGNGEIERIVEEKDASPIEKTIKEINTGFYCVRSKYLFESLRKVRSNNSQNEYYLTDIVNIMKSNPLFRVGTYTVKESFRLSGVNDLFALSQVEAILRMEQNKRFMLNGVAMINPETITIGSNVIIEEGVVIQPNTFITGDSVIKKKAIIGPNTEIHNSIIGERAEIRHSLILNSQVGAYTTVGPFAHLRDGSIVGEHNRIGNFVEVKKSTLGNDTKASHLAYIGDATIGSKVNFGCGAVTVNYDGKNKFQTVIGDEVFIGCNTNLIAPITVESGAYIAAGSTLTENVPHDALAIARAHQVNKEGYATKYKKKENDLVSIK